MKETTVEQRVSRLEREVRWWRMLGVLAALVVVALLAMGQASRGRIIRAERVEAQEFVLWDASGKMRARLGQIYPVTLGEVSLSGGMGLTLFGSDGAPGITMSILDNGEQSLSFVKWEGPVAVATLGIDPSGSPGVFLGDKRSNICRGSNVRGPSFIISSKDGSAASLRMTPDGSSCLLCQDSRGTIRAGLGYSSPATGVEGPFFCQSDAQGNPMSWPTRQAPLLEPELREWLGPSGPFGAFGAFGKLGAFGH